MEEYALRPFKVQGGSGAHPRYASAVELQRWVNRVQARLTAGYRFKSFDAARAMASANPNEDLKSPEELEEEDRAAKSAVGFQRRYTPTRLTTETARAHSTWIAKRSRGGSGVDEISVRRRESTVSTSRLVLTAGTGQGGRLYGKDVERAGQGPVQGDITQRHAQQRS